MSWTRISEGLPVVKPLGRNDFFVSDRLVMRIRPDGLSSTSFEVGRYIVSSGVGRWSTTDCWYEPREVTHWMILELPRDV